MKKRIVKKWINRYLTPITKGIPKARYDRSQQIVAVINGEDVPEGNMYQRERNPRIAIKKQAEGLQSFMNDNKGRNIRLLKQTDALIYTNEETWKGLEYKKRHPRLQFFGVRTCFMVNRHAKV